MGRPTVCLQTVCRLIELALTGYALWYFAESGRSGCFWLAIAAACLGQQGAAVVASICLRQLKYGTHSEAAAAARTLTCGSKLASPRRAAAVAVAAHCLLCGDIWWFVELVVVRRDSWRWNDRGGCGSGDARDDPRYEAYALCRLLAAAASSAPLSIVAASAYVDEPHAAPGLCALTSAASVAITWAYFHDYGNALGRARRCALRALAFVAKASIVLSRLSAVSRVAGTFVGVWVVPPLLVARVAAAAAAFSIARRDRRCLCCGPRLRRQDDDGDDRRDSAELRWRARTAQAVRAAAYCSDLLLLPPPEECTRSLIAAYYSLVLLENCALAVTWYAVVGGDSAETATTRERLLWLAGDFASLTFGVLMTLLHCSAAAAANAIATGAAGKMGAGSDRRLRRSGAQRGAGGDVTPATDDDYEWDPYDGDIRRRRASFTNAAFELECSGIDSVGRAPARPPLAIVLPYSALDCSVTRGGEPQPAHRADGAHAFATEQDADHHHHHQQQSAAMASPAAAGEEDAAAASDDGSCRLDAAAASSATETESKGSPGVDRAAADDEAADAAKASLPRVCVAGSGAEAGGDFESAAAAAGGWGIEHNVAYLNCGFVASADDDDEPGAAIAAEDALPRYLPHAPRSVFTTRWHSASYGLNVRSSAAGDYSAAAAAAAARAAHGGCSGARSARTLPGVGGDRWRRKLSSGGAGGGGVVDDGREAKNRPSACAAATAAAAAAARHPECAATTAAAAAAASPEQLPPLDRQAAALTAATAAETAVPEHWVRRWLRQVVSRQKPLATAQVDVDGPDFAPDTLF